MKKKVAIIGAGAMGSLFAYRIASNSGSNTSTFDPDVWLISSWTDHIEKINKEGLVVDELSHSSSMRLKNIHATASIREVTSGGPVDVVFILVKTPYTRIAAEKTKLLLTAGHKTTIVTVQNGLGNLEAIQDILSHDSLGLEYELLQGVTDQGSMLIGPGHVSHTGFGVTTLAGDSSSPGAQMVMDLLSSGGMETKLHNNVEGVVWGKLILNAGINPLTALFGLENGQLAKNEKVRAVLKKVIEEALAVAIARGTTLPYGTDSAEVMDRAERVLQNTASNKSSMLTDILRGVSTEIDSINGMIVKEGERLGVDVGFNKSLVQLVRSLYRVNGDAELGTE